MSDRTWFITGASRGFGRSFTNVALAAGDRVAATARDSHRGAHGGAGAPANTWCAAPTTAEPAVTGGRRR